MQNIVRQAEGILQGGALIGNLQQAIVGDGDQCIGMFLEFADALLRRTAGGACLQT